MMREIADPYSAPGVDARDRDRAVATALSVAYTLELEESIERWRVSHAREYEMHRVEVLKQKRLMGKRLNKVQQSVVDHHVAIRIRDCGRLADARRMDQEAHGGAEGMNAPILTGPGGYRLELARRGDTIEAPALNGTEPMMLMSACDGDLLHVFFCEPCKANFANTYNLALHLEKGGDHRIAVWCPKRRIYEPADVQQLVRELQLA